MILFQWKGGLLRTREKLSKICGHHRHIRTLIRSEVLDLVIGQMSICLPIGFKLTVKTSKMWSSKVGKSCLKIGGKFFWPTFNWYFLLSSYSACLNLGLSLFYVFYELMKFCNVHCMNANILWNHDFLNSFSCIFHSRVTLMLFENVTICREE